MKKKRIPFKQRLKKFLDHIWIYLKPFLNWRFLICYLIPWMITNGIWYLGAYLGAYFKIDWLTVVCSSYLVWLYTPFAQEKLLIIPVALWLCKVIFKNHPKTKEDLDNMWTTAKDDFNKLKNKFKRNKDKTKI